MAIAYDFDGTLAPGNMQEHEFTPELGIGNKEFWMEANQLAAKNDMDGILAYMQLMLNKAREANISIKRESFENYGKSIRFFDGVESYFDRINEYAKAKNLIIEHYIISSGLREFVSGTSIAKYFKRIFASGFKYNDEGIAEWPAVAINYNNKTQYLYRINKGFLDVRDVRVNDEMSHEERAVPFSNIVYIGDSATDIPSMRLIYKFGGTAIGLYQEGTKNEAYLRDLLRRERISYVAKADYSENGELDILVKDLIKKLNLENQLAELRKEQKNKR